MEKRVGKDRKLRWILGGAVALSAIIIPLAVFAAEEEEAAYEPSLYGTFWALIPPIVAIALALITKEVFSSLFLGILVGGILWAIGSGGGIDVFSGTFVHVFQDGFLGSVTDSWNVAIIIFMSILGVIIVMMSRSGGAAAFGRWAQSHIKTRAGAQLATMIFAFFIFVDDYFNCLTVGSVMRSVTDSHKVSRAKLAYIIDSTAAPICIIAPISTWAAAVSSFAKDVDMNGFQLFVNAIPYNFYALLTIFFMFMLVASKVEYGPMRTHEINAIKGDIYTTPDRPYASAQEEESNPDGRVIDLVFPIIILIVSCVVGLLYSGGFFGGGVSVTNAFADSDASIGLLFGSIFALLVTIIYYLARRLMKFGQLMECLPDGWRIMIVGELVLIFAWTINSMTGSLGAADFVEAAMQGSASGLQNMLPAMIYLVACGLAFATGTSWGTFGILIPIVVAVFAHVDPQLTIIGMSACMAGGVFGDHCSPISDTTVLSSAGAQSNHINHVQTQLPYALTVGGITFACFVIAGFARTPVVSYVVGAAAIVLILFLIKRKRGTVEEEAAKAGAAPSQSA
jgi:Na+/H+ antiporter NhaC